jgi:hypothetical protein
VRQRPCAAVNREKVSACAQFQISAGSNVGYAVPLADGVAAVLIALLARVHQRPPTSRTLARLCTDDQRG